MDNDQPKRLSDRFPNVDTGKVAEIMQMPEFALFQRINKMEKMWQKFTVSPEEIAGKIKSVNETLDSATIDAVKNIFRNDIQRESIDMKEFDRVFKLAEESDFDQEVDKDQPFATLSSYRGLKALYLLKRATLFLILITKPTLQKEKGK